MATTTTQDPLSGGATNDTAEGVLRKFLNPALKGKAWDALIAAFAVGDQYNWDNAKLAFDQLFKTSASGMYLDRKNGDDGLKRPANIGISDELYRQLGIKVTNAKLTEQVILEILEVFYGSDSLRGHIDTGVFEPYALSDGDTLTLNVDGVDLPALVFRENEFSQVSQATALEVATSITSQLGAIGSNAFAIVVKDPATGTSGVRIYSGALGLISSVQVTGGLAQKALRLEQQVITPPAGTDPATLSWDLTVPQSGSLAMKISGSSALDMNQLQVGDYVLVTGAAFDPANRGSFPITAIDIEYVGATYTQTLTVANDAAVAQTSVGQASLDDVLFFRPVVKAIHNGGTRTVVVSEIDSGAVDVVIPATTQAVNRTPGSGAYVLDNDPLVGAQVTRDGTTATVTTSTSHGLAVGSQVAVEEVFANTGPTVHAGSSGVANASLGTLWVALDAPHTASSRTATKLKDGQVLLVGGSNPAQLFTVSGSSVLADGAVQYSYAWADSGTPAARSFHTATLLGDGSVFVAAGAVGGAAVASTERWAAGAWTAGPNLATARQDHQAQLLNDGRVLILGGDTGANTSPLASCEIYDGSSIAAGPSMLAARTTFASVKLSDGRVLAIGGNNVSLPASGPLSFGAESTAGFSNGTPRWVPQQITTYDNQAPTKYLSLVDGNAIVVNPDGTRTYYTPPTTGSGGYDFYKTAGCPIDSTKCFLLIRDDPALYSYKTFFFNWADGTFTQKTSPPTNSDSTAPVATLMADGRILVVYGPFDNTAKTCPTYIYDPTADTWTATAAYPGPYSHPQKMILMDDGRILDPGLGTNTGTCTAFNPSTGVWDSIASGTDKSWYSDLRYGLIRLHSGKYLSAISGTSLSIFDPATLTWTTQPYGPDSSSTECWAVEYAPNKILVHITNETDSTKGVAMTYDIDTQTWATLSNTSLMVDGGWLDVNKIVGITTDIGNDEVIITVSAGSAGQVFPALASCEVFDGTTWTATGSMSFGRAKAAATLLPDGRVLVTGGTGRHVTRQDAAADLATCEIYDPNTGRWSPAGKLRQPLSGHTMAWTNGKLVVGSEYFDPTTGTFKRISGAQSATEPLAVQVQDGLVLAIGQSAADLLVQANDSLTAGGLNGVFRIDSVPSPTSFTYKTPNVSAYSSSSATVRPMAATSAPSGFKGPFVLDTQSDVAITGVETTSTQDLFKGQQYTSLKVADATAFPDEEGYLVIGYGTATVSYPVHYLGRISGTELLLDYQQKMPATNLAGASVTLLKGKAGLTSVDDPGSVGLLYATDSGAGRAAAQEQLENVVAAGIDLNLQVVYPGDQGLGRGDAGWVWSGEES